MDYTLDEMMVVCIARQVKDGQVVAQGLATPLVTAAYLLAKRTHAPHLYFMSAIGQGICRKPASIGLLQIESLWLDQALTTGGFVRGVADVLPCLQPLEFFRPAQVDPHGNFNNIAFGRNYHHPKLRLPGTGGIPDVTTYFNSVFLYVPRHSRLTFVPELDFLSGLGHYPERTHGAGPSYLVSNLGQFDFAPVVNDEGHAENRMRLLTYHPGVDINRIQNKTGFDIIVLSNVTETATPTEEEIRLLREEIDPLGIRRLELLSGAERRKLLHQIITRETIH
jgi:acyl CoA:acetate/3-ketoacid CoA transferase beta subunit